MLSFLKKINLYKILFVTLIVFIFIEIIIVSPTYLESDIDEASYGAGTANTSGNSNSKNSVEQKMRGIHFLENRENEKGWQLFADEATGTTDGKWMLNQVRVEFFKDNISSFEVVGDLGEVDEQTKNLQITGNVITKSSNGYSFKTNTLRYLSEQKIMTSLDQVLMEGPPDNSGSGFILNGEKLLVDLNKNKMSILDQVVAKKTINSKKFTLSATRADFSNRSQEAVFSGGVKMLLGNMNVAAPVANFNYLKSEKNLSKITLINGVEFSELNKKGTCNELVLDMKEDSMTMRGQPKVQIDEDEIKGYEIVFLEGGKKVKINKSPNL